MDRSYVQILNEMFPNQTSYVEEGRTGPHHRPLFGVGVHVNGLTFHGLSYTKQKARHEAAKEAIDYFRSEPQMGNEFEDHYNRHSYPHQHVYRPNRHNYERYEPYYRWGQRKPLAANPLDDFYGHSNYNYESQNNRYVPIVIDYQMTGHHYTQQPINQYNRQTETNTNSLANRQTVNQLKINLKPETHHLNGGLQSDSTANSDAIHNSNDFTVDDYDHCLLEFNEKVENDINEDTEDTDSHISYQLSDQISADSPKKERIILRVMTETPVNKNPVSVIHELQPNAEWVCTEINTKRHSTTFEMQLLLPLAKKCFTGTGKSKKLAKTKAASKALLELYNISLNEQNGQNKNIFKPNTTIHIAQEPLLLKQDLADRVGAAVMSKLSEVSDKLNDFKKWSVLSAIVLTDEANVDFVDVICLTSGTKCVKGDNLSMNGYALNDCHAEVLARRSFIHYIYSQIEKLMNHFEDNNNCILERRSDGHGFRIKANIKLNLFISTAPCGDSRVFSPKEEKEGDAHPNRQTRGLLRAKIEGGEGTIPVKREAIQTWDGILQGHQRLQFMSCSDKIAVWNIVGIQGALLSHLIEPIYLSSVVLASLFNYEHLVRAIHGRFDLNFDSSSLKCLPQTFLLNKCKVAKCRLKQDITRQLTKAPNYAFNWIKGDDKPELVSTESGRIHVENVMSRLAKKALFSQFCALLGRNSPVLSNCCLQKNIPVIYRDGKTASIDYQRAKTQCMQTFQEQNLGIWLQVPAEIDLFSL